MADAGAFDLVCQRLETSTSLDRLAARGTVRIALKQAGLDSRSVTPEQMAVVIEKLLVSELASRGIANAPALCADLAGRTRKLGGSREVETPDAVFRRLGG